MDSLWSRIKKYPMKHFFFLVTAPVIYSMLVPIVLIDLCVTVFQWVCFPAYQIPRVRRRDYIVIDRAKLSYLNAYHKLNCLYCEYANGVIAYVGEILARTEWFWCPIKHACEIKSPHAHYDKFMAYGDGVDFRAKLKARRKECRACDHH